MDEKTRDKKILNEARGIKKKKKGQYFQSGNNKAANFSTEKKKKKWRKLETRRQRMTPLKC